MMPTKLRFHGARATFSVVVILALAVAGLVAFSGGEAAAVQQVSCGDTITADTTLHYNLANCPNNGVVIGADNVTLDLNYHRIDGDGTPAAGCDPETEFCDTGVVNDGHDGVTVVHGSVREFAVRATHNRLLGIASSGNGFAGLGFFRGSRSLVRNCSGNGSGSPGEEGTTGMFLIASHHVRVLKNSFKGNSDSGMFIGVRGFESTHNLIKGNLTSGNEELGGLHLGGANRNRVVRNRSVRDRGFGIIAELGSHNVFARNHVLHTRARVGGKDGDGIAVEKGRGNLIADNIIVDARKTAIRLAVHRPAIGGGHNVVRDNLASGSGGDDLQVNKRDDHSLLKRNIATGAGHDGFDIESRTAKLTRNEARRNRDLGIEAVRGVIDGGGNKASGNGDPRQCTHIVCG
jgi:large repetitive protein